MSAMKLTAHTLVTSVNVEVAGSTREREVDEVNDYVETGLAAVVDSLRDRFPWLIVEVSS